MSGYVDLFKSNNGGITSNQCSWWSLGSTINHGGFDNQSAYNLSNVYVHADCNYLTNVNGAFYACTDGFLCKSINNGLTWQKLSLSTGIRENYNLGVSQSNHYRTICGSQDNGLSLKTEIGWSEFQYQPTYWKRVDKWQENAQPVLTGGWAVPTKKLDKEDPNLLEKDIDKSLLVLRELYYKLDDVVPSWHNIVYLDIEIEMGGALTPEYIKAAPMPITSIALRDVTTKQYICFIVDKSKEIQETIQDGKHIIPCYSEKELVKKFLDKWEELDPTIVVGYNSAYFDIPYMYFRIKLI